MSLEGWYQDLGDFDGSGGLCGPNDTCPAVLVSSRASIDSVSLRLMGHLPVGRRVTLYGFAGSIDWEMDLEVFPGENLILLAPVEPRSGTDLLYGAGLEIALLRRLHLFVDYERFDLDVTTPWIGLR